MTHAELLALVAAAERSLAEHPSMPLALATLVRIDGSSYRQPGACMLCTASGEVLAGAISGGCLEADVALRADVVCAEGRAKLLTYDLREDLETIWGFGTGCFGAAHLLLAPLTDLAPLRAAVAATANRQAAILRVVTSEEHLSIGTLSCETAPVAHHGEPTATEAYFAFQLLPPVHCVVVGNTQGADAMAQVATLQGWHVSRMPHDPRDAHDQLAAGTVPLDHRTVVALCTHRFAADCDWLRLLVYSHVPYIGILGARQRAVRLLETLEQEGIPVTAPVRARIFAPIGLDIGAESPVDIALAAVAEMLAVINERPGGSLKHRTTPLHERTPTADMASVRIPTIILAAGASRRLGEPKQLLRDTTGYSLLRRVVEDAVAGGCAPVYVVVGAHDAAIRAILEGTAARLVVNAAWEEGMSSSIRAGIAAVRSDVAHDEAATAGTIDGVLLMPCDQPAISAQHIRSLRAGFQDALLDGPSRIVSRYQGVLGTPAIWPVHDFDALSALSGDRGARTLLHGNERAIDLVDGALDLETPADVAAWRGAAAPNTSV